MIKAETHLGIHKAKTHLSMYKAEFARGVFPGPPGSFPTRGSASRPQGRSVPGVRFLHARLSTLAPPSRR